MRADNHLCDRALELDLSADLHKGVYFLTSDKTNAALAKTGENAEEIKIACDGKDESFDHWISKDLRIKDYEHLRKLTTGRARGRRAIPTMSIPIFFKIPPLFCFKKQLFFPSP